jgi:hypothetical protein
MNKKLTARAARLVRRGSSCLRIEADGEIVFFGF